MYTKTRVYRTHTLKISHDTFVFLSSVESIISGLPSPGKVVTLSQSPQNPESPIPDGPTQQWRALQVERVYPPSTVQSQSQQHAHPATRSHRPLSSSSEWLEQHFIRNRHPCSSHKEKMHLEGSICFLVHVSFGIKQIKLSALT